MSHMASGILATLAATLTLGAVHLEVAAGNDLLGPVQRGDASVSSKTIDVNRTAKGDRQIAATTQEGVTISLMVPGAVGSSVVMRVPAGTLYAAKTSREKKSAFSRQKIACELTVSQMSPVARQLQPGRCLT